MTTVWPDWTSQGHPYGALDPNECKQQFSISYASALVAVARCTLQPSGPDFEGVDFTIRQVADHALHDRAQVDVQIKCTAKNVVMADGLHFELKAADYAALRNTRVVTNRILIVVHVPNEAVAWTTHSDSELLLRNAAYWVNLHGRDELPEGQTTKTVVLSERFTVESLLGMLSRVGAGERP